MIVTDGLSGGFPDMLLRNEIGSGCGQPKQLDARVVLQERLDQLAAMPSSPIPEEQDRLGGIGRQEREQKEYGCRTIHRRRTHDRLFAGLQVKCAIEMGGLSIRRDLDDGSLSTRVPDSPRCGLQVK